ncbi:hypothetical protein J4734_22620, partial [Klebsiella pneumoniae]|nr:hypothetical protein [Klebsiella pneumoniae]
GIFWRVGDIERLNHSRLWVVSQNAEFPFANSSLTFAIPTYLKNKNLCVYCYLASRYKSLKDG